MYDFPPIFHEIQTNKFFLNQKIVIFFSLMHKSQKEKENSKNKK